MSAPRLLRCLRLLPIAMASMAILLFAKGWGLAVDARAQGSSISSEGPKVLTNRTNTPDPAVDDSIVPSTSAVDVMTNLSKRRADLEARERDLVLRNNLILAAARRVDMKIAELKDLQAKIEMLLGQRDAAQKKQLDAIVKSYSSMKPKDAARIFNGLSDDVLVPVTSAMKPDVLGAVLAQMQPEDAQKLTVKLANRLKVSLEVPKQTQIAAVAPSAAAAPVSQSVSPPVQGVSAAFTSQPSETSPPVNGAVDNSSKSPGALVATPEPSAKK